MVENMKQISEIKSEIYAVFEAESGAFEFSRILFIGVSFDGFAHLLELDSNEGISDPVECENFKCYHYGPKESFNGG